MAHSLIVGMTISGKTTLGKALCRQSAKLGKRCLVLDPLYSKWEGAAEVYHEQSSFVRAITVKKNWGSFLFIDEGGVYGRYNDLMNKLATLSRHLGDTCFFIAQRAKMLDTTVTSQCTHAWLFPFAYSYEKQLYEQEFNVNLSPHLPIAQYHFIKLSRFQPMQFGAVNKEQNVLMAKK